MELSRRSTIAAAMGAAALTVPALEAAAKQKMPLKPMPVSSMRRVLIQSSSRYHKSGYLDFAGDQYELLFQGKKPDLLFIPYAMVAGTYDDYEARVPKAFKPFGHKVVSIHHFKDPVKAVREAQAIAVGGGNTWALVTRMYEAGIIDPIRERVNSGALPYCGWSAGGNVACPTHRTTNDMPIAEPPSFNIFGFIPFQTNPHFILGGTAGLNNETREDRIEEFIWYNPDEEVIGLPEGTALFVTGEHNCEVIGPKDSEVLYWFRQAQPKGMKLERIPLGTKFDLRNVGPGKKLA